MRPPPATTPPGGPTGGDAGGLVAGVDVGGTKILGVLLDGEEVVGQHRRPTPQGADALAAALLETVAALRAAAPAPVSALGVGVPGLVDRAGTLRFAPNLPGVVELPVGPLLAEGTGLAVQVDNDATCAAWGERSLGAARGADDCVLVTLGTGIGGGIVSGGRLLRGAHGFAGEIGHMVVDRDGPACPCGRRGCWERFGSGGGLGRLGRAAAGRGAARRVLALAGGRPDDVRGEHVTAAALEGDAEALALVEQLADWVAVGLATLVNVVDPGLFVLAGGLVRAGEALLGPVRQAFSARVVAPDHRPPVGIVLATLGERAGAIGAALLAPAARPAGGDDMGFAGQVGR